jgi:hypothetical protein
MIADVGDLQHDVIGDLPHETEGVLLRHWGLSTGGILVADGLTKETQRSERSTDWLQRISGECKTPGDGAQPSSVGGVCAGDDGDVAGTLSCRDST